MRSLSIGFHARLPCSIDSINSGQQFDVDGAILATLKGLLVDLDVKSNVKLDDSKRFDVVSLGYSLV